MIDVLIAMKRESATECLGLGLAVVDTLKSFGDYLSDLSCTTDCRRLVAGGPPVKGTSDR
jgi:hypothetical protein